MMRWMTDNVILQILLFFYKVQYVKPAFSDFYCRECYRIIFLIRVEILVFAMEEAYNVKPGLHQRCGVVCACVGGPSVVRVGRAMTWHPCNCAAELCGCRAYLIGLSCWDP